MIDERNVGIEHNVYVWSMRAGTKTLRVCVVDAETDAIARARAEDYLVSRGVERNEAVARMKDAYRQLSELRDGVFGFWTEDRR